MKSASVRNYFERNPGALFVIVFQVLVLACAFLLNRGSPIVDDVAVLGYGFLVVGVVLQAAGFIREKTVER